MTSFVITSELLFKASTERVYRLLYTRHECGRKGKSATHGVTHDSATYRIHISHNVVCHCDILYVAIVP